MTGALEQELTALPAETSPPAASARPPADKADAGEIAAIAAVRRRTLTSRLRLVAAASMGVIAALVVASIRMHDALPSDYTPLRLGGLVGLGVFVAFTYHPAFERRQLLWGWMMVTGVASLSATGALMRGNPAIAAILESMMVLLTSAVLPWGFRPQAACVASSSLVLAVVAWELGPYPAGDPDLPVLVDAAAAFALSLFIAHATRTAFDNAVVENLRLQAARAQIRALADELEAKVRSRTAELEASLADQRSMTRAISHDLRQPLRHIASFAKLLEEGLGSDLADDHRQQLTRVATATARMDRMVDALLEISRVAGQPVQRQPIDLTRMARDLGETLARSEPARCVRLSVEEGLRADGDPGLVRNMLHALLANAWKFTRHRQEAVVEVGRHGQAFYVRDNGSGFDMQHSSRMFGTFERLHHPHEFEGEGVGLAVAERVVRRHGGRIWAESDPGLGATFLFTLSTSG